MFAILRTGGKQYRVAPGDKIVVERLDGNAGDTITLGDILLAGEGSQLQSVDKLKVLAEIVAQAKGEKVTVFKKRRRHNYRRKKGHRQLHTILKITAIGDHKAPKEEKKAPAKAEAKPAAAPAEAKVEAKPETKTAAPAAKAPKPAAAPAKKAAKPAAKAAPKKVAAPKEAKAAPKASTKNAAPAKKAAKTAPAAKKSKK
ncbi:MAG: 50S ribosomal protein L21 [Sphingomicrobium sp.]